MRVALLALGGVGFGFVAGSGCASKERPPLISDDGAGGEGTGATGGGLNIPGGDCEGPPTPDTAGLCGNEVVPIEVEKPNLYFLLDTSGSMEERIAGSSKTKLLAAKDAIFEVASELGHRIRYGLAHYPSDAEGTFGCGSGAELFSVRSGDPIECVNRDPGGPVLDDFETVLRKLRAEGGTPLSGALAALGPSILALEGKTAVILLTDGAPNCNLNAVCGVDRCTLNVEELLVAGRACDDSFNCCDPANMEELGFPNAGANCVDDGASIASLERLREAGIPTYVIGVPGTEAYAEVMNGLAEAGGTARSGTEKYYDVGSETELLETLKSLGASLSQSCEITLEKRPTNPFSLNVYLDAELLENDEDDGWTLDGAVVTLAGDACRKVRSGDVNQIQVVTGCETVIK